MSIVVFSSDPWSPVTGSVDVGEGASFDVGAALAESADGTTITVDTDAQPTLYQALLRFPQLTVVSIDPAGPVSVVDFVGPVFAHSGTDPQQGDILIRGKDGVFTPLSGLNLQPVGSPVTSVNGETGNVTLDANAVGADQSGAAQNALLAAENYATQADTALATLLLPKNGNLAGLSDTGASRNNLQSPELTPVSVVATGNVTLSGTQTIDGRALSVGERVLATGQSTSSQNGVWVVQAGTWTRPTEFPAGGITGPRTVTAMFGTAGAASEWVLTTSAAITIDTNAQSWTKTSSVGGGGTGTRGSLWYSGVGAPGSISGQLNNDFYVNKSNNDYYELIAGTWTLQGNLTGPTGPTGPGGGAVTGAAGGALTATYGRTSTIAVPYFRDFVQVGDFMSGTNGNGTVDDSAGAQNASNALNALGGGVLQWSPLNPAGALATWTIGSGTGTNAKCTMFSNTTVYADGAQFQRLSSTTHFMIGDPFNATATVGSYVLTDFKWVGGLMLGSGSETQNQTCFNFSRIEHCTIRDFHATNWTTAVVTFNDSFRCRLENAVLDTCGGSVNNINAINITTTASGTTSTQPNEIFLHNVVVSNCPTSGIVVTYGNSGINTYAQTIPTRVVISNCMSEANGSNSSGFLFEIGGNPSSPGVMAEISMTHCIGQYTGSVVGSAVTITNDSSTSATTPVDSMGYLTVFSDINIDHCQLDSNFRGVLNQGASRVTIAHCHINCTGTATNSGNGQHGDGIFCAAPQTPSYAGARLGHIRVTDCILNLANTVNSGVSAWHTDFSEFNFECYFATGGSVGSNGLYLLDCFGCNLNCQTEYSGAEGIKLDACGEIDINQGTRVYNPSTATGSTTAGIKILNVLTGDIRLNGARCIDDRGASNKMTYGLDTNSATTTATAGVYSTGNTYKGWKTAMIHGTVALQIHDSDGTPNVSWTGGNRETWLSAAPTVGTWAQGDRVFNTAPTSNGTAMWICTASGNGNPTTAVFTSLNFTGGAVTQGPWVVTSGNLTLLPTDQGAIVTAPATITLPTGITLTHANFGWGVKHLMASGNIQVQTQSGVLIDPGVLNQTQETIQTPGQCNFYNPAFTGTPKVFSYFIKS